MEFMSRSNKSGQSSFTKEILADIQSMSADELLNIHGISINEDQSVHDQAFNRTFPNIDQWISFSEGDEDDVDFEKFGTDSDYGR